MRTPAELIKSMPSQFSSPYETLIHFFNRWDDYIALAAFILGVPWDLGDSTNQDLIASLTCHPDLFTEAFHVIRNKASRSHELTASNFKTTMLNIYQEATSSDRAVTNHNVDPSASTSSALTSRSGGARTSGASPPWYNRSTRATNTPLRNIDVVEVPGLSVYFSFSGQKSKNTDRRDDYVGLNGETSWILISDHYSDATWFCCKRLASAHNKPRGIRDDGLSVVRTVSGRSTVLRPHTKRTTRKDHPPHTKIIGIGTGIGIGIGTRSTTTRDAAN